jgi:NADPH:quinone reductase-like Zn-dependent oxidoreductase
MIKTQAWILDRRPPRGHGADGGRAALRLGTHEFAEPGDDEVLVEPILGCWEGNMSHALCRDPIDVCQARGEASVVLGNAGVVRVLRPGREAAGLREGDLCLVFCNGVSDPSGYPLAIYAYDAPGTTGLLAKRTKLGARQLIPIPEGTRHGLAQWAAFSLRYVTAWANWKSAFGCWRVLSDGPRDREPQVWGWGGGVALAEATLARRFGCAAALMSSDPDRLRLIGSLGLAPVDRRGFAGLAFDPARHDADPEYRDRYAEAERRFLETVRDGTHGDGVAIFVDLIGAPVFRATLKALARPGVVTTSGWKQGMRLSSVRALECLGWHTHVHTHYARYHEGVEAVRFAEETGWMPRVDGHVCPWEGVARLGDDSARGGTRSYFPIYQVNPL